MSETVDKAVHETMVRAYEKKFVEQQAIIEGLTLKAKQLILAARKVQKARDEAEAASITEIMKRLILIVVEGFDVELRVGRVGNEISWGVCLKWPRGVPYVKDGIEQRDFESAVVETRESPNPQVVRRVIGECRQKAKDKRGDQK